MTMKEIPNQCYNDLETGEFRCKRTNCIIYIDQPRDYIFVCITGESNYK
jgi:hypothetical protein